MLRTPLPLPGTGRRGSYGGTSPVSPPSQCFCYAIEGHKTISEKHTEKTVDVGLYRPCIHRIIILIGLSKRGSGEYIAQ